MAHKGSSRLSIVKTTDPYGWVSFSVLKLRLRNRLIREPLVSHDSNDKSLWIEQ